MEEQEKEEDEVEEQEGQTFVPVRRASDKFSNTGRDKERSRVNGKRLTE